MGLALLTGPPLTNCACLVAQRCDHTTPASCCKLAVFCFCALRNSYSTLLITVSVTMSSKSSSSTPTASQSTLSDSQHSQSEDASESRESLQEPPMANTDMSYVKNDGK